MKTETISDQMLSKIRKLLALASNNPNENEAAAAAEKVQSLLQDYNLSMADIGTNEDKTTTPTVDAGGKREKTSHDKAAMYQYQRSLMKVIAEQFFCRWWDGETFRKDPKGSRRRYFEEVGEYVTGRYVRTHFLLGKEVNVVSAKLLYDYLIETMDKLLPYQGMEKRGKNALLWLEGCTERLTERLEEITRKRNTKDDTVTAQTPGLVRLSDVYSNEADLNTDAYYGYPAGTTAARRKSWEEEWEKTKHQIVVITEPEETPAERAKREKREAKSSENYWRKYYKQQRKVEERRSSHAFKSGRDTGDTIGLNEQVK